MYVDEGKKGWENMLTYFLGSEFVYFPHYVIYTITPISRNSVTKRIMAQYSNWKDTPSGYYQQLNKITTSKLQASPGWLTHNSEGAECGLPK